ncbi:MAG: cytochrome C oxidase subunit IV family protein [Acidimicrobiia bacterium]|nr:cytochrome C oxidase subunit IV family protein [Acidimicrobiia bacterium]
MSESQIQSTVQKEHTSPAQYVLVGGVLVGLTAMEISLYYMERHINRGILMVGLYGVAAIKFFLVAAFFMHLKDDAKVYKRWFILGGLTALTLFAAVLVSLSIQDHRFF